MVSRFRFSKTEHTPSGDTALYYRNEVLRGTKADACNIVLVSLADSRIPGVTRAFNFGSSLTTARACLCTRKEHDRPRQKALAPPEAQAVLWVARLAADMSDRVLWNGEARVRRHMLFLTRRVSAEVALAKTQRPPCPRQRATDWQRPNLARAGLVALM